MQGFLLRQPLPLSKTLRVLINATDKSLRQSKYLRLISAASQSSLLHSSLLLIHLGLLRMRQPLRPLSKTFREEDRKCPLQMPSTEQKEKASRRTAREDDILPYEDKTNRRAFFPASLREGGGPRSGGRSPRAQKRSSLPYCGRI